MITQILLYFIMVLHLCVPKRVKILLILFIMFIVDFDGLIINLFKL